MKVKFKPFDLEAAKNGEPVMTRGGGTVEFIGQQPRTAAEGKGGDQ